MAPASRCSTSAAVAHSPRVISASFSKVRGQIEPIMMRIFAKLMPALLSALLCCCTSTANERPVGRVRALTLNGQPVEATFATLPAKESSPSRPMHPTDSGSRLSISVPGFEQVEPLTADLKEKWANLQFRIRLEQQRLASCRTDATRCSPAESRFWEIVELGLQRQGLARLGEINRAVNTSIKPGDDWARHGVSDFWSTPLETLASGAGDCEDYVALKYQALKEAGVSADDLRILIVAHLRRQVVHAVLAVRSDENWLILDNLTMVMVRSVDASRYRSL